MLMSRKHPSQDLWDKIEWRNEGPHVNVNGNVNSNNPETTDASSLDHAIIVAYFPGSKQDRLPPLWRTRGGRVLVESDLQQTTTTSTTTSSSSTACNTIAVERLEQALQRECDTNVLPQIIARAILEEGLQDLIRNASTTAATSSTTTRATSTTTTTSSSFPLYYTISPNQYLHPPAAMKPQEQSTTITSSTFLVDTGGYAPSALLQRCKAGCFLAHNYRTQLQHYTTTTTTPFEQQRRSRRLAPPTVPNKPNPLVRGGNVCAWWLEECNKRESDDEETILKQDHNHQNNNNNGDDDDDPVHETLETEINDKEETTDDNDDNNSKDDDFEPESSNENDSGDDEEELMEQADESLSIEESSDDDEESSLEEDDLIVSNPHFQPTLDSLLDWMGRRGKSLSMAHVQNAVCTLLREQVSIPIKAHLDRMVVLGTGADADADDTATRSHAPPLRVVLECTTGETVDELETMETSDFAKCRFRLQDARERDASSPEELDDEETQKVLEEQYYAELKYKRDKAWATWRYKAIQTGFAKWPQWLEAVTEWRKKQRPQNHGVAGASSSAAAQLTASTTHEKQNTKTPAASALTTEDSDLIMAQAIEEESFGRRRTRRAAGGDGGGVFYGGQTGMSHKQLMDTIVRMAYQQPFQTMMALQSLVAEESNNPLHRIRVALGKLLWKHNLVNRVCVNSVWTDMPMWNILRNQALLQVPAQFKAEEQPLTDDEEAASRHMPTKENREHLKVLTEYIRNLHRTELELRSLILHHFTSTPIVTVATAADERAGSLEAVDATDFEGDHSALDWSTSGHELLNQAIFRPSFLNSQDALECTWYKIKDYVPSVPLPPMEEDAKSDGRPREVVGKEPLAVERRMRFRAYPVTEDGEDLGEGAILVLTEGQVRAGIMAANLERKKEASTVSSTEHPFAISAGTNITLQSCDGAEADKHCQVAGYDTVVPRENSSNCELEHRILLLPQLSETSEHTLAFWAIANIDESGVLTCRPVESSTTYKILQSDCDSSSSAFQECEGIVEFLFRQPNSQVFAEPVDPVALNIPTYFSVIKHPMDISTLSANLEKGVYSKIPPGQNVGRSPVARMLNGPFKDDVMRIFDNAMLFNPPDDWIHHAAASMKKAVLKKIDQVSRDADDRFSGASPRRKKKSIYVDEDSDVDMYEYESDRDDDDYSGRRTTRKRKRIGGKDDFSTHAMEAPVTLLKTLSETLGLRGPFSNLPIDSEAEGYSLSSEWSCRHQTATPLEETKENAEKLKRKQEMEELLMLHRQVEEMERAGLRRSSRAHPTDTMNGNAMPTATVNDFEYFLAEGVLPPMGDEETDAVLGKSASSRSEVESHREALHEVYFAKLYQQLSKYLAPMERDYGSYVNTSFPPFLGRVMPSLGPENVEDVTWEIRTPYVLPAIRWVLRGLVDSGHLTEVGAGVLLTNNIYYADDSLQPFDVLDVKEMQRRKRANAASGEEESEEEVEMSEYEKLRAERVARNAERLKALGLA